MLPAGVCLKSFSGIPEINWEPGSKLEGNPGHRSHLKRSTQERTKVLSAGSSYTAKMMRVDGKYLSHLQSPCSVAT
ncbi:hypothetical protein CHARACLAT_030609 [Characodon lateralis]|uniref:Uncharacterized protein n=1 Tax=Characodon lateralis TaxID=208331 RepID=A0ABU7F7C4_9TELE|nr:hypothetical protein [Characodon lateralis]